MPSFVCIAESFVHLQDDGRLFRLKLLEQPEQFGGVEGFQVVVRADAGVSTDPAHSNNDDVALDCLELLNDLAARQISDARIEDDTIYCRKLSECLDSFSAAVCGDDVEFGCLNDELAGGDTAGMFLVYDEKAGSDQGLDHSVDILWCGRHGQPLFTGSARHAMLNVSG
jgi:hypothetical protein